MNKAVVPGRVAVAVGAAVVLIVAVAVVVVVGGRLGVERRLVSEAWALCRPEEEPDDDDTVADGEDEATADDGTARHEYD